MENPQKFFEQYSREVLEHEPEPIPPDPLLAKIESAAAKTRDEALQEMLQEFKNDCLRYLETILRMLVASRKMAYDPETHLEAVHRFDEMRRTTHNVVIDDVNIIARTLAKDGWDTSWRDEFETRDEIGEWAQKIALTELSRSFEKEASAFMNQ